MNSSTPTQHLLVSRFSSMGDVAMTVPVVKQLLQQYPAISVTFVSDVKFRALFEGIPRLTFFGAELKGRHKGFKGILKLFNELKKIENITAIADLHDVLRSKVLSFFFTTAGKKTEHIDKGRKEKRALTRKRNKKLVQLPSTFQRYADVFARLGFPVDLAMKGQRIKLPVDEPARNLLKNDKIKIGIAPFGKHKEKTYPVTEMEKVVTALSAKGYQLYLFGGNNEKPQLENWENKFPNVVNMAGKLSFKEELACISHLDLMISMDSANMHLASLYGVEVVSIWGATHPFAGFYGFSQNPFNAVQKELYCRPCSVFGNKPCYRGDWACMQIISPEDIINKVEQVLNS